MVYEKISNENDQCYSKNLDYLVELDDLHVKTYANTNK
jgi:hypothetical protein